MDDAVIRAMAKWPNVPAVYGWLGLGRRGRWLLRGDPIHHEASVRFISRNYDSDERGCWYFQNGPQRVFVSLEYTPYVYALDGNGVLESHTGVVPVAIQGAWLDDAGGLLLQTELGVGVLDDRDLASVSERMLTADGRTADDEVLEQVFEDPIVRLDQAPLTLAWEETTIPLQAVRAADAPLRFGFVPEPGA